MEDAATAEISRSQIWQWIHNDIELATTAPRSPRSSSSGSSTRSWPRSARPGLRRDLLDRATALFKEVALAEDYAEFLTLPAYERMP